MFEVDSSLRTPDDLKLEEVFLQASKEHSETKTGPLTIVPVSMAYVSVAQCTPKQDLDAIVSSLPVSPTLEADPFAERNALLRRKFSDRAGELGHVEYVFDLGNWGPDFSPDPKKKYGSMLQIVQYPFSRGSVHVRPSQSSGSLVSGLAVDPQYFGGRLGHVDLEIALHGYRFAEKICSAEPLASIIRGQVCPMPAEVSNDDSLREWLKRVMTTDWHPVGTCAMGGRAGSRAGVVDARLRVYGVRGLRVVDASVMPLQISAHLQATVYAIAEKAAHMILQDIGLVDGVVDVPSE